MDIQDLNLAYILIAYVIIGAMITHVMVTMTDADEGIKLDPTRVVLSVLSWPLTIFAAAMVGIMTLIMTLITKVFR